MKQHHIRCSISIPSSDGSLFHSQGVGFTRLEIYSVIIAAEDVMKLDIEKKRMEEENVGRFEGTGSCSLISDVMVASVKSAVVVNIHDSQLLFSRF